MLVEELRFIEYPERIAFTTDPLNSNDVILVATASFKKRVLTFQFPYRVIFIEKDDLSEFLEFLSVKETETDGIIKDTVTKLIGLTQFLLKRDSI
jgi:hypothetical protein